MVVTSRRSSSRNPCATACRPGIRKIAALDPDFLSRQGSAGKQPLGDTAVARNEMQVIAVVHIGQTREPGSQALAHLLLAEEAASARFGPARHVENAVLAEELHDRIELMCIEAVEERLRVSAVTSLEPAISKSPAATRNFCASKAGGLPGCRRPAITLGTNSHQNNSAARAASDASRSIAEIPRENRRYRVAAAAASHLTSTGVTHRPRSAPS